MAAICQQTPCCHTTMPPLSYALDKMAPSRKERVLQVLPWVFSIVVLLIIRQRHISAYPSIDVAVDPSLGQPAATPVAGSMTAAKSAWGSAAKSEADSAAKSAPATAAASGAVTAVALGAMTARLSATVLVARSAPG